MRQFTSSIARRKARAAMIPPVAVDPRSASVPADAGDADWAVKIRAAWNSSREKIVEVGRLLIAAKAKMKHGDYEAMIRRDLPFGPRTAQMLAQIAADSRITDASHGSQLPASWRTLYALSRLDDYQFATGIRFGGIRPDMRRKDVLDLKKSGTTKEGTLDAAVLASEKSSPRGLVETVSAELWRRGLLYRAKDAATFAEFEPHWHASHVDSELVSAARQAAVAWERLAAFLERIKSGEASP